jgi:Zn-finger nucleic acid-binding protein
MEKKDNIFSRIKSVVVCAMCGGNFEVINESDLAQPVCQSCRGMGLEWTEIFKKEEETGDSETGKE